jgi:hypothetical protein
MAKEKITHNTHGLKGHYLSGHDNIKHNKSDEKSMPMDKTKQNMRHRTHHRLS